MVPKLFAVIRLNDKGREIEALSKLLIKAGSTMKPTKEFHIGMQSAVKAFQRKHKLPVTGEIDLKTYNKLMAYKLIRTPRKK